MGSKGFLADEWQPMRQLYANRRRIAGSRNTPRPQATRLQPPHPQPRRSNTVQVHAFRKLSR